MTPTTTAVTIQEALNKVAELLKETKASSTPFEFNKFPIIIPVREIFKVRGDTEKRYVDMDYINKQLRAIRRDGNMPKQGMRVENLDLRIGAYLLSQQDVDPDLGIYGDTYFYMEGPSEHGGLVETLAVMYTREQKDNTWWALVSVQEESEAFKF